MTYNVFSGTLNPTQSVNQPMSDALGPENQLCFTVATRTYVPGTMSLMGWLLSAEEGDEKFSNILAQNVALYVGGRLHF